MRIFLLSNPGSIHTVRWANSLAAKGLEIFVFGLGPYDKKDYVGDTLEVYSAEIDHRGLLNKLKYLGAIFKLKQKIKSFKPDLVHAHYLSSYGLLGRLCGFRPLVISAWGTDVFDFPRRSFLHKLLVKWNLKSASKILATSQVMALETLKYTDSDIEVTPFGIDHSLFTPIHHPPRKEVVIGTVKSLYSYYGIDVLIESFHILRKRNPDQLLKLVIGGEGDERPKFETQVSQLGETNFVDFIGRLPYREIPGILNAFDIFAALSDTESFGVAVIEASACELPVVVTSVGGLPEIVEPEITGLIVPPRNPEAAADAFEKLLRDPGRREQMGKSGRIRSKKLYDWDANVDQMIRVYQQVLKS